MPQGRECFTCSQSIDKRTEIEMRVLRGDQWSDIAEFAGCSYMSVQRHMQNGHASIDWERARTWMTEHAGSPSRQLERATNKALARPDTDPRDRILDDLYVMQTYGVQVLKRMEVDADWRGSSSCIDSLTKLLMAQARIEGLLTGKVDDKQPVESHEVIALRESIMDAIKQRTA